jgi:hypothetical protein
MGDRTQKRGEEKGPLQDARERIGDLLEDEWRETTDAVPNTDGQKHSAVPYFHRTQGCSSKTPMYVYVEIRIPVLVHSGVYHTHIHHTSDPRSISSIPYLKATSNYEYQYATRFCLFKSAMQ